MSENDKDFSRLTRSEILTIIGGNDEEIKALGATVAARTWQSQQEEKQIERDKAVQKAFNERMLHEKKMREVIIREEKEKEEKRKQKQEVLDEEQEKKDKEWEDFKVRFFGFVWVINVLATIFGLIFWFMDFPQKCILWLPMVCIPLDHLLKLPPTDKKMGKFVWIIDLLTLVYGFVMLPNSFHQKYLFCFFLLYMLLYRLWRLLTEREMNEFIFLVDLSVLVYSWVMLPSELPKFVFCTIPMFILFYRCVTLPNKKEPIIKE